MCGHPDKRYLKFCADLTLGRTIQGDDYVELDVVLVLPDWWLTWQLPIGT